MQVPHIEPGMPAHHCNMQPNSQRVPCLQCSPEQTADAYQLQSSQPTGSRHTVATRPTTTGQSGGVQNTGFEQFDPIGIMEKPEALVATKASLHTQVLIYICKASDPGCVKAAAWHNRITSKPTFPHEGRLHNHLHKQRDTVWQQRHLQ